MTVRMGSRKELKLDENLKLLMTAKNLTVTMAAKKVGMNKSTLHNYCNGVIPRNLRKIKELADLLDVSLTELLYGKDVEQISFSTKGGIEGRYEVVIRRVNESENREKR
jgi:transcriptional regulator with XRE-family HTH domain